MEYRVASRDYLERARLRLAEDGPESLFYAAFELRCGIEARMQEYLEVQDEVSKKKKGGWRIAELGKNVERMFRTGDKIGQFTIKDDKTGNVIKTLYYTPVTSSLRKRAQQLGDLLHASKDHSKMNDAWWRKTNALLSDTCRDLQKATTGTLLGMPLRKTGTNRLSMNEEVVEGQQGELEKHSLGKEGTHIILEVKYLDDLP